MLNLRLLLINFGKSFNKFIKSILLLFVYIYRSFFGFWFGGQCRFEPSCSSYAIEALQKHNITTAINLIFKRLSRCRPGGGCGHDPVP